MKHPLAAAAPIKHPSRRQPARAKLNRDSSSTCKCKSSGSLPYSHSVMAKPKCRKKSRKLQIWSILEMLRMQQKRLLRHSSS
jgi:hypothetical protein